MMIGRTPQALLPCESFDDVSALRRAKARARPGPLCVEVLTRSSIFETASPYRRPEPAPRDLGPTPTRSAPHSLAVEGYM